jgi:multiple sugar transport system substrate-binding protein
MTRRDLLKLPGAATLAAAGRGPSLLFPERACAQQKTLRIALWTHLVPGYDQWFDEVYTQDWGQKHDTKVVVDHLPVDRINAVASAEVAAGSGHDLFMFPWPPATFHQHVIDHAEVYQMVAQRHGNVTEFGHKSTFHPTTKKYFAFADSWIPAPLHFLGDLWAEANTPLGPSTYDTLRAGVRKIRLRRAIPCGLALARGLESNITLQSLLWGFRTSFQDADGNVSINSSYMTIQALKYVKALYEDASAPEALTWGPSGNVQAVLARRISCTIHGIDLLRLAEKEKPELAPDILLRPPMLGPGGILSAPHVTSCWVVWNFSKNQEGAKQFLSDLIDSSKTIYEKSQSCNFPIYQDTVPDLVHLLAKDPKGGSFRKYWELKDALHWTRHLGYPGFTTPQAMEVLDTFVIPRMFASVVKGDLTPEDAARAAEKEVRRIFDKWKQA